jgi:hypothetical protein
MGRRATIVVLFGAGAALVFPVWGCGSSIDKDSASEPSVSITGLYPDFNPAESRYVSRCGRDGHPIQVVAKSGTKVAVGTAAPVAGTITIDRSVPAGDDFKVTAIRGARRDTFQVRCLPADFPQWRFQKLRPIQPGLFVVSFRASPKIRPWIIVFDHEGVPRWWYSPPTSALLAQILRDGNVAWARSFGDGYGLDPRMAHEVRSVSGKLLRVVKTKGQIIDGHEFRELGDGNVLVDTYAPGNKVNLKRFGGPSSASAVFAEIQELNPEGRVVWRWNSRGKIGLAESGRWWRDILSNGRTSARGVRTFDPVHINSIEPRGPDEVVVSMRHTDAIYGIERSSGDIRWKLGGTETAGSLRIVGDPAVKTFGGQHDARIGPNGVLSIYDNGQDRPRLPRVVFYRLDLAQGTATYLGQLNEPGITRSHCCGSARPLPGGGWLVSWGANPLVTAFDAGGRTAFRLELAASTFRAIPVPVAATTVAALDRGLETIERGR